MARIARVAVENAALSFDKIYTYLIPEDMDARPGCRVTAPFGAGNRTRFGIVMETADAPAPQRAKTLVSLVDEKPLLDAEMLALARWLRAPILTRCARCCRRARACGCNINTCCPAALCCPAARTGTGGVCSSIWKGAVGRCGRRRSARRWRSRLTRLCCAVCARKGF